MEMGIFAYKTRIWIDILVDFGNMGGWGLDEVNEMRSPYRLEALATTYTVFFIDAQFNLYMEKMSWKEKK